jgi:hypothetical protein
MAHTSVRRGGRGIYLSSEAEEKSRSLTTVRKWRGRVRDDISYYLAAFGAGTGAALFPSGASAAKAAAISQPWRYG